ncbi:MAG: histidine phosphatase family protein [Candidatus Omnitrophica bacterium]|nr:histidine phosphatase family protein [Candidatus Omnitrophota bacterium]MDE2221715.1 histidine phosphatase family protein [Candidatus Omnitrophota bacterium]
MELYFLRHGLAGQHGDPKYKDDSLRPLTAEGVEKMHRESLGMKALDLKFDCILSSPYLRARQTAETVAKIYNIKKEDIHLTENLLEPACAKELLAEIRRRFPKKEHFLLVGHEPHLTELISSFLESGKELMIDLKKGGLCSLSLHEPWDDPDAVLNWLLTPSQLTCMGQAG